MANKKLFQSAPVAPRADTLNEAGGLAYTLEAKHALAQAVVTSTFHDAYYTNAQVQLGELLRLANEVAIDYLAKAAVYARQKGKMKDAPAILAAILSKRDPALFAKVFDRVIDNVKMVRNFVQIMRAGIVRKSLGSGPKRLLQKWFSDRTDEQVFRASIGDKPSLGDVLKLVHPKPNSPSRAALYGYLTGAQEASDTEGERKKGEYKKGDLPGIVKAYEAFKSGTPGQRTMPDVPFEMLTALDLTPDEWKALALNATWTQTRMNLNTFQRHGVFESAEATKAVVEKLRSREEIAKARLFPYQLFTAYLNTTDVPAVVREALQDAMEIATENVPAIDGKVVVVADVSGSMGSPITGVIKGATSKVRVVDVVALIVSCVLRKSPKATAWAVDTQLHACGLNPRDTVVTNAQKLASYGGGGTDLSLPLQAIVSASMPVDFVLVVSDCESWVDSRTLQYPLWGRPPTRSMMYWEVIKGRSPKAKMFCLNVQPGLTTQVQERDDILNYGGWSDAVFDVIADFAAGRTGAGYWTKLIEEVVL